jgi:PAS domain S-box-containing protein
VEEYKQLSEAFDLFTRASESLQSQYRELQEKVSYLTSELENKKIQLESALSEAESAKEYLQSVIQSLDEAIAVIDSENRVLMLNKAFEDLFGVESSTLQGVDIKSCKLDIRKIGDETYASGKKGKIPVFYTSSLVENSSLMPIGRVIQIKDITSLKEIENQKLRNKRLIAMGEMATKIVHEVRNPLCGIELYATMLYRELEGTENAELAQGISAGIRSLNNLLTNMLYFSREQKPRLQEADLNDVIEEAVVLIRPVSVSRGIPIAVDSVDCSAMIDRELIKQVMLNLLLNALQAIESSGTITVSTCTEEDQVLVYIADSGKGIEDADLERIFDPFFSTKTNGTGLGLAISSRIVQAHGGYMNVKSRVGKGTEFVIKLPGLKSSSAGKTLNLLAAAGVQEGRG